MSTVNVSSLTQAGCRVKTCHYLHVNTLNLRGTWIQLHLNCPKLQEDTPEKAKGHVDLPPFQTKDGLDNFGCFDVIIPFEWMSVDVATENEICSQVTANIGSGVVRHGWTCTAADTDTCKKLNVVTTCFMPLDQPCGYSYETWGESA